MNIFQNEIEQEAIMRIKKFSIIAKAMCFNVSLGFSGGKDSQVCYDLCLRSGIEFKAYFNHAFESSETLKFIRERYPDVIKRRDYRFGFIENIRKMHGGLLPTVTMAYCCEDYKHNPKYIDLCSIVGVRKAESAKRHKRTAFEAKNKTTLKKNKSLIDDYFEERCQSVGSSSVIQLKPIIDWSDDDVWSYIHKYDLPVNPEYRTKKRVGCLVCPKANFTSNAKTLLLHPKIINAFIIAREKGSLKTDWIITSEHKDCYWINATTFADGLIILSCLLHQSKNLYIFR